jgi:hypothetical protein
MYGFIDGCSPAPTCDATPATRAPGGDGGLQDAIVTITRIPQQLGLPSPALGGMAYA